MADTNVGREQHVETLIALERCIRHGLMPLSDKRDERIAALDFAIATLRTPTSARGGAVWALVAKWRDSVSVCGNHLQGECEACAFRAIHASELEAALAQTEDFTDRLFRTKFRLALDPRDEAPNGGYVELVCGMTTGEGDDEVALLHTADLTPLIRDSRNARKEALQRMVRESENAGLYDLDVGLATSAAVAQPKAAVGELPELPEPASPAEEYYTADQMREYARAALSKPEDGVRVDDAMVERAAKAVERMTTAAGYGWTDEQFDVWWNADPLFVKHRKTWADFTGTLKERRLWEARIAIESALATPQDQGRDECPNCEGEYPDSCWYCDRERNAASKAQEGGEAEDVEVLYGHDVKEHGPWIRYADHLRLSRPAARQPSGEEWQPIERAPKDGRRLLLTIKGVDRAVVGMWNGAQFLTMDGNDWSGRTITHFREWPAAYTLDDAGEGEKYAELIFAVGNKYPGETRHETALRYIRQAESGGNDQAKSAIPHDSAKEGR